MCITPNESHTELNVCLAHQDPVHQRMRAYVLIRNFTYRLHDCIQPSARSASTQARRRSHRQLSSIRHAIGLVSAGVTQLEYAAVRPLPFRDHACTRAFISCCGLPHGVPYTTMESLYPHGWQKTNSSSSHSTRSAPFMFMSVSSNRKAFRYIRTVAAFDDCFSF